MDRSKFDSFHVKRNGERLVYDNASKGAGKPAELEKEELFAIELIGKSMDILNEFPEQFPDDRRLASINIWKDHISVTVTQYEERGSGASETLGYVFTKPGEDAYTVFRQG